MFKSYLFTAARPATLDGGEPESPPLLVKRRRFVKVWKIIFVCLMLLLLRECLKFFYYAALGPDVSFKLDDNHYLYGWPGFLVQYKPDGSSDVVMFKDAGGKEFCPSFINKYAVSDKYIVAKAKEGWFAVNRATLQSWGCYDTIDDLENKVGEKFGALELVEEFSQSNIFVPPSIWIAMGFISLVFVGITVGVLFLPAVFKKKMKLRKKGFH